MSGQICLFVTAIVSILVSIILAISIAWIIPDHTGPIFDTGITRAMIRRNCGCLPESDIMGFEEYMRTSTHEQEEMRQEWITEHPYLVAVSYLKYVDDHSSTHLSFGGTGVILTQYHVIAGSNIFMHELKFCSQKKAPKICIGLFRLRFLSYYWSAGGNVTNVTDYYIHEEQEMTIFKVATPFTFHLNGSVRSVPFMAKDLDIKMFYFIGWGFRLHPVIYRYMLPDKLRYVAKPSCLDGKISFTTNATGITARPLMTECQELAGFSMASKALDIEDDNLRYWIEKYTGLQFQTRKSRDFKYISYYTHDCYLPDPKCGKSHYLKN